MNLQPLYDLKERLEHIAIAGTGLLGEDFRLRRAVENMVSLSGANPVFVKITAAAKNLLSSPEGERPARLLDVLSLVDAVVYTQGITNVTGELEDLAPGNATAVQAPYSALQPLIGALSGMGTERTNIIRDNWQSHPEYFTDFRVVPHVIQALGDRHTELAEMICQILTQQGKAIIPALKENFDPQGRIPMARRVKLVAKLAGEEENGWYISVLPDSAKEVREALIQALSLSRENNQLLLDLCHSEKGKLKEAALRSLANMDSPEAFTLWQKEISKKPGLVANLAGVGSALAASLAARTSQDYLFSLTNTVYSQMDLEQIKTLTAVLCGKHSDETAHLWHWIAEHMDRLHQITPDQNIRNCDLSLAEHLEKTFLQTVLWNAEPGLLSLARELAEKNRKWFLGCAMLADMAGESAETVYMRYAPCIVQNGLLKPENDEQRNDRIQILKALAAIRWSRELGGYCVLFSRFDALTGEPVSSGRKLDSLDPRWLALLTDPKVSQDGAIYNLSLPQHYRKTEPALDSLIPWLIDRDNPEICEPAGHWLYRRMMDTGNIQELFHPLLGCGWKNWQGVLAHIYRKQGQISYPMTTSLLRMMPLSNAEKAAELRQLNEMAQSKQLKIQYNFWPQEAILRDIAALEADPNAQL